MVSVSGQMTLCLEVQGLLYCHGYNISWCNYTLNMTIVYSGIIHRKQYYPFIYQIQTLSDKCATKSTSQFQIKPYIMHIGNIIMKDLA